MKPYRQFLALTFITRLAFAFSFATYVMFLLSRGATLFEIGLINVSFMVAIALAEIPTGIFADFWGRKRSFQISCLIMALGLLIYFYSNNFWMFIAAEMIAGIGMTFRSGALEAWVVDAVSETSESISNEQIFSSASIVKNVASIIGGLTGAYMGDFNLAYPWLAGAIVLVITFIASSLVMSEPKSHYSYSSHSPFAAIKSIFIRSIDYGLRKKVVFLLMLTTLISAFFYQPLNMYWQPRFAEAADNRIWILGWIWVFISGSLMLGGYLIKRIPTRYNRYSVLIVMVVLNSVPVILAALIGSFWPVLLIFGIYEVARGVMEPIRLALINDAIPSAERATILSLNQVFMRLGAILGLLLTGMLAEKYSISAAWIVAAVIGLSSIPILIVNRRAK